MHRIGVLTLISLALGCGGDAAEDAGDVLADSAQESVAADTGVKACDLASAARLEEIVGEAFREARTTNDYMGVSQCKWDRAAGSGDVTVSLHRKGNFENYSRVPGATPVGGLGDEAVWNPETRQLAIRSGEAVMSVSFLFEPAEQEWAKAVARAALETLTTEGQAKGQ